MPPHLKWERYSWKIRCLVLMFVGLWGLYGPSVRTPEDRAAVIQIAGIGAASNLLLWLLLRKRYERIVSLAILFIDLFLAYYTILLTGGYDSPLFVVFFVPLVSSAILFGSAGCFAAFIGVSVLYALAIVSVHGLDAKEQTIFMARVFFLGLTAMLATYISQEEKRRTFELNALRQVSRFVGDIAELQTTLNELVSAIAEILNAEKTLFMLYDSASEMLVAQQPSFGLSQEEVYAARLPRGEGISWEAFSSGKPVLVNDAARDPRTAKQLVAAHSTRSLLTVPLKVNNQTIGVIHVINKRDGASFSQRDSDLLELLAGEAALILELAHAHRAMNQERGTLEAILHSMRGGVVVTDPQGHVILVNHDAERILEVEESRIHGRHLDRIVADPVLCGLFARIGRGGREFTDEVTFGAPGETTLRVDSCPVLDDKRQPLGQVTILSDITDLKNLDRLKTEFIATVSHELRTPLTSIKAYAATLLRANSLDHETRQEFLNVINDQCDRLTGLINDLLDIGHLEKGEPIKVNYTIVNLEALVERVVKSEGLWMVKGDTTPQGHRFHVDVSEAARTLGADERLMERVLANLVSNAVKYSPNGGVVTISSRLEDASIILSVQDEGTGIPAHRQGAIFNKFYQLDGRKTRRRGGSGLGLYLVKHLVEAMRGEIWVESRVGLGATFFVKLPQKRGDAEQPRYHGSDKEQKVAASPCEFPSRVGRLA